MNRHELDFGRIKCVLRHALIMAVVIISFAVACCVLDRFDPKHFAGEILSAYAVITLHLCSEKMLKQCERLTRLRRLAESRD